MVVVRSEPAIPPTRPWWERVVFALGLILALAALIGLVLIPIAAPDDGRARIAYITFMISLLAFPAVALVWWRLTRDAERPDRPGVWSAQEQQAILLRIQVEAEAARARADGPALRHLAREAWLVADRLDGEGKADAVALAVALEIRTRDAPRDRPVR